MKQILYVLGALFLICTKSNAKNTSIMTDVEDFRSVITYPQSSEDFSIQLDHKIEKVCSYVDQVESLVNKVKKDKRFHVGDFLKINMDLNMSIFLATVLLPEILSERFHLGDKSLLKSIGMTVPAIHLMFILAQKLPISYTSKIKSKLDSFSKLKPFVQVAKKAYTRYKKSFSVNGYTSFCYDYIVLANKSLKVDNLLASIGAFGFSTLLPDSFASKLGTDQKAFLQYVCFSAIAAYCVSSYLPDFIYSPLQKTFEFASNKITMARDTVGNFCQNISPAAYAFFLNNCVVLGDDLKKLVGKEVIEKAGAPLLFAAVISGGFLTFKKCASLKLLAKATASVQNILKFASATTALYSNFISASAMAVTVISLIF